jgi:hypothetical protein
MIWSDPWITEYGGLGSPPTPPPLPPGVSFHVYRVCDMSAGLLDVWCRDLVATAWSEGAVRSRLEGAWIALLLLNGALPIATCVLRPRGGHIWLLETFVARPKGEGRGTLLVRHAIPWVWSRGCRSLIYTWELGVGGLAVAWWRGWLRTATVWWWGWVWKGEEGECGFCGGTRGEMAEPRFVMPMFFRGRGFAVVSDSGLRDGWGYVLATRGAVDWRSVQQKGGWRALWYRGTAAPEGPGWKWTGEVVVVGVIGEAVPVADLTALLATAEIAP